MTTKLTTLIDRHKRFYEQNEKTLFDKARMYYQGNFFRRQGANSDKEANMFLCSKNLIYAIADTAVSALLGPNPQVSAQPRNPISQEAAPAVNGLMEYTFQTNKMRRRAATALIDAVLCKRGIFKTGWSVEEDRPVVKVIDPSSLFFDLTVRDVDDIRYWIEATVVPYTVFKERVASGRYKSDKIDDVRPDRYPSWILGAAKKSETDMVRDAFEWVTIYEYYDRDKGIVQHYIKQADTVIFEEKIDYIPYSMFSLNQSGVDCLGLSEVQLVLNQQETINDLLTHMKQITYLMVPRILYDSGRISEEDLNKAVEASAGAFVGISPENSEALRTLATLFYEMPMPQNPVGVEAFVARQEGDAAFISALAEAARGQVTGARTATEMAIIDAQMRTRLATREGHLNTAIEDVAAKCFYLCRKYMKHEKMVRVAGSERWFPINHETIHEVMVNFEMVSYNPIRQNPSVLAETLVQLLPFLQQNPHVDVRRLTEEVVSGLGLPNKILMNQMDVAAKAEAEAALQQQLALGGAAAPGGGPPPGGGGLPPELAALMGGPASEGAQAADSLAAGGGTPLE
jgi:hypothetical protein